MARGTVTVKIGKIRKERRIDRHNDLDRIVRVNGCTLGNLTCAIIDALAMAFAKAVVL